MKLLFTNLVSFVTVAAVSWEVFRTNLWSEFDNLVFQVAQSLLENLFCHFTHFWVCDNFNSAKHKPFPTISPPQFPQLPFTLCKDKTYYCVFHTVQYILPVNRVPFSQEAKYKNVYSIFLNLRLKNHTYFSSDVLFKHLLINCFQNVFVHVYTLYRVMPFCACWSWYCLCDAASLLLIYKYYILYWGL